MREKILYVFFISIIILSGFSLADANVTTNVETTGVVHSTHDVRTDDEVYVYINGVDWSGLPYYITESEDKWNDNGLDANDLAELLEKIEGYRAGQNVEISQDEYDVLMSLLSLSGMEITDFYNSQISPVLNEHYGMIQEAFYNIETFHMTMEKLYPDVYCESRQEVMKKYGLKSVKCGLHSKQCYNGNYYPHEGGLDYCVYTDDENRAEEGLGIRMKDMEIYDSEEQSLTTFRIDLFNQGEETLNPVLKVDIKKWENTLGHFEQELGEVEQGGSRTYYVAWDNSELKPGDYTARATVYLGRKEILKDIDFTILREGSLAKNGEIVSLELKGEPLTYQEIAIETMIKNHGTVPTVFQVTGEVYRDGEKLETIESGKVMIKPGETGPLNMGYRVPDLGEYEVIAKSNDNMEDMLVFEAVPSTLTGRFLSSPGGAVLGMLFILAVALYGLRFSYRKISKKGTVELVRPLRNTYKPAAPVKTARKKTAKTTKKTSRKKTAKKKTAARKKPRKTAVKKASRKK